MTSVYGDDRRHRTRKSASMYGLRAGVELILAGFCGEGELKCIVRFAANGR